jgi:hypothetical protein
VEWIQVLGGSGADEFIAVALDDEGHITAAGHTTSTDGDLEPSSGSRDALIAGFSSQGDLRWSQTLGG